MDFSAIVSGLTAGASMTVGALTAIAALKILVDVARWGYDQIIGWFGGDGFADDIDRYEADDSYDRAMGLTDEALFHQWEASEYERVSRDVVVEVNMSDDG